MWRGGHRATSLRTPFEQEGLLRGHYTAGRWRLWDAVAHRFVISDAERLELRLCFLLERFKMTSMRWHFVLLTRCTSARA